MENVTTKVAMEYVKTLHQRSNDARYMSICEKVNEAKRALIREREELESKCNAYDTYVSLCCERGGSYDAFYSFSDSLYDSMRKEMLKHVDDDEEDGEEYEAVYDSVRELSDCDVVAMYIELFEVDEAEVLKKLYSACNELRDAVVNEIEYMTDYDENETLHELRNAVVNEIEYMTDYDENEVEECRMSYRDELARRYGWPLKIHARGYDAYLVGAQPLEGGPAPIYRFPGGDSLVDECEMLPAEEASDE